MFYTLQITKISSPKTFSEKPSGLLSMLERQGPLIGASPSLSYTDSSHIQGVHVLFLNYSASLMYFHRTACIQLCVGLKVIHINTIIY